MPDERKPRRTELDLEHLRSQHSSDTPSAAQRAQLLSHILQHEAVAPPPTRTSLGTGLRRGGLAIALGVSSAVVAVAVWRWTGPAIHPEPTPFNLAAPATGRPTAAPLASAPAAVTAAQQRARRCTVAAGDAGLLADFEQAPTSPVSLALPNLDQRHGEWVHMRHDPTLGSSDVPLLLVPQRTPVNNTLLHVQGAAGTGWGANIGLRLSSCYDASAYGGVQFRARGPGSVFLAIQTVSSVPVEFGGECREKCWFTGGRFVVLSKGFETHRIHWSDINGPEGEPVEKALLQVMFSVQSGAAYDFWLDDVKFFPRAATK